MSDKATILRADKYVDRDGGVPHSQKTPEQLRQEYIDNLMKVTSFLAWMP